MREIDSFKNDRLIISVHIPKTGGTSFAEILKVIAEEVFCLDYGSEIFSPICPDVKIAPMMQNDNPDRSGNFYDLEPGLRWEKSQT